MDKLVPCFFDLDCLLKLLKEKYPTWRFRLGKAEKHPDRILNTLFVKQDTGTLYLYSLVYFGRRVERRALNRMFTLLKLDKVFIGKLEDECGRPKR